MSITSSENAMLDALAIERDTLADMEAAGWIDTDWSILDSRRGNLPDFPVDTLPASLHDWVSRAAHGSGTSLAHVAVPLIGIVSGLLGTARRVQPSRSWSEPATVWCALVGFSGTGKTPGIDRTRSAVGAVEHNRKHLITDLQLAHETRAQAAKAAKKKWEKEVEEAIEEGTSPPNKPNIAMDVSPFVTPRLVVSDATVERLAVLLEARPRGMTLVADELSRLFLNMSRYSGGQDNEFWLEAWNGKHYTVERQGRPAVIVQHLLVGVVGGFQPDKVALSFAGAADGMYARILFSWPDEPKYQPLTNEVAEVEPEIQNAIARIVNLPAEDGEGSFNPRYVQLSNEAVTTFEHFRHFLHMGKAPLDGRERDWWSKGGANVLRIALILAYLDWGMRGGAEPVNIGNEFIESAVKLWQEYFWPHSRAAIRQIGITDHHANGRRALQWVRANQRAEISVMEIRRDALGQSLDAKGTEALLNSLEQSGWLRKVTSRTKGRARHRWTVHPALYAQSAVSARSGGPEVNFQLPALSALPAKRGHFGNGRSPALGPPGDSLDDLDFRSPS